MIVIIRYVVRTSFSEVQTGHLSPMKASGIFFPRSVGKKNISNF
jgi:hypothetical protein